LYRQILGSKIDLHPTFRGIKNGVATFFIFNSNFNSSAKQQKIKGDLYEEKAEIMGKV